MQRVGRAVVKIVIFDDAGSPITAVTGFVVTPKGHIITAAPIVEGAKRVEISNSQGKSFGVGHVLAVDRAADLALLDTEYFASFEVLPP